MKDTLTGNSRKVKFAAKLDGNIKA